jgi:hypothetical protein
MKAMGITDSEPSWHECIGCLVNTSQSLHVESRPTGQKRVESTSFQPKILCEDVESLIGFAKSHQLKGI